MATQHEKAISTLNHLIETSKDGIDGFRSAAAAVKNADAQQLFTSRVPIIEHALVELQAEVRRLGGDPETSGSTAAAVHRGWLNLRAAITGKDEAAVITECLRGEELAVKRFEDALDEELPFETRELVERQYRGTVSNLEKVRALGTVHSAKQPTVAPHPEADAR